MSDQVESKAQRKVIIASANLLFARGLEKILRQQVGGDAVDILHTRTMKLTIHELENWLPDVVIVDYDDRTIDRAEFLRHFVSFDRPMQVMLVSLGANGTIVVYERRKLNPDQVDDWLNFSDHAAD